MDGREEEPVGEGELDQGDQGGGREFCMEAGGNLNIDIYKK